MMNYHNSHVFIVDDTPATIETLSKFLNEAGFIVSVATDGESALEMIQDKLPDIILLDVMMPGLDGFETCQRLKENPRTKHIPVIFMMLLAYKQDIAKVFEVGAVDYVKKPLYDEEVLARLSTHLKMYRLQTKLQRRQDDLEKQIAERTHHLEIVARLSKQLNAILDLDTLLITLVNQIKDNLNYYHVHVYLLDETDESLIMVEGSGSVGITMKLASHAIAFTAEKSLVAKAARLGQVVQVKDVQQVGDWLPNVLLPETKTEIAVPIFDETKVIGVLDVQDNKIGRLTDQDMYVLSSLASQVGVAIQNAKLYGMAQQANKNLIKLNADKDKFFSIIAHDLKGPFMPLLGHTEILSEMVDILSPDEIRTASSSINKSAQQVYKLLENLLEWARIHMGRMVYKPEHFDLQRVVTKNINLLRVQAISKEIMLQCNIPEHLFVYADEYMVDTVIRNLINNALKFTSQGGQVTISTVKEHNNSSTSQSLSDLIEISIRDNGVGMSEEVVNKLFTQHVHRSSEGTNQEKGTGLGLSLCHEMVKKNGGQIWVESILGQGTDVKFTLVKSSELVCKEIIAMKTQPPENSLSLASPSIPNTPPTKTIQPVRPLTLAEFNKMNKSVTDSIKSVYDLLDSLTKSVKDHLSWVPFEPTAFDLQQFINQNIAQLHQQAIKKQITLQNKLSKPLMVQADENLLGIVLYNLILTAIRFSPNNGLVTILARRSPAHVLEQIQDDNTSRQYVELSISDTGRGMNKKALSNLFKANTPKRPQNTNVILGLIMYREIIHRNGGQIWVDSRVGRGTKVKFTIPMVME